MASDAVTVTDITPEQRKAMAETLRAAAKAIEDQTMLHHSGGMVVGPCEGGIGIKANLVLSFAVKH